MNKKEIINSLEMIALYLEIKGENSFKVSAYRRAALTLESDSRTIDEIGDLSRIKGIGKGTLAVIEELLQTGKSTLLVSLQEELPDGLITLLKIPGLGGKKIAKLYQQLGITDLTSLKQACEEQRIRGLPGFGAKTEEKLLSAIENVQNKPDRLPIAFMLTIAERIEEEFKQIPSIINYSRAGSLRRLSELVKDIDFIIATNEANKVAKQLISMPNVTEIVSAGPTKVSVILSYDEDVAVDFRIVKPDEFATTLHHFTGSKEHNVKMRQLAKQNGERINEYGIENLETGKLLTFENEEAFFSHFELNYIPPEIREGKQEITLYKQPVSLIDEKDIKGDIHTHTTWSDGANSIEEMVIAAIKKGYEYIAITDHSQFLRVANGLTPKRLREQRKQIDLLNEKYQNINILAGIEMDILPDGSLDFEDEVLAELDLVIASIHSSLSQGKEKIMERLRTAMENKYVNFIAHPTGRIIGRRNGYHVDFDLLIKMAKETNTALELNANPNRLDLEAKWLEIAQENDVKMVINTDAHVDDSLKFMSIGTRYAKKGKLTKESVINTLSFNELCEFLKAKRS